jgi:flagellar protein FliL
MRKLPLFFFFMSFFALGAWQGVFFSSALAAEETSDQQDEGGKTEKGKSEKGKKNDKKKGEEDITGGRFAGDPIYVHIQPMILPIISDDGVEQLVSLMLDVRVKDLATANALHKNMPRVIDSLWRNLYGGLDEGSLRDGKLVNVGKIKNNAIRAVGEIAGRENILDVLVVGVAQRML